MSGANPFFVLSYVGGPAILTNAAALLLLSTSNRFARAIDRARFLTASLSTLSPAARLELGVSGRRVRLIARAMTGLYLSAASFALATLLSIAGAVFAAFFPGAAFDVVAAAAAGCGLVGFGAFVIGAAMLVIESRLAVRALALEAEEALSKIPV
jgi:Protein of unknown function (DUF2721)